MEDRTLAPHVAETRDAATKLHVDHQQNSTRIERFLDRLTSTLGRPAFLGVLVLLVVFWVALNLLLPMAGFTPLDRSPFPWLEGVLTLLGLMMGVLILSTQRRAAQLDNLREQITLELASLTERKVGKMIELIEELRRDSPEVKDRVDVEAAQMAERTDQNVVMNAIKETHEKSGAGSA